MRRGTLSYVRESRVRVNCNQRKLFHPPPRISYTRTLVLKSYPLIDKAIPSSKARKLAKKRSCRKGRGVLGCIFYWFIGFCDVFYPSISQFHGLFGRTAFKIYLLGLTLQESWFSAHGISQGTTSQSLWQIYHYINKELQNHIEFVCLSYAILSVLRAEFNGTISAAKHIMHEEIYQIHNAHERLALKLDC